MSAAVRKRRHRERERHGLVVLTIAVPREPLTYALEVAGLLPLDLIDDRCAVARAVEALLAEYVDRVSRVPLETP